MTSSITDQLLLISVSMPLPEQSKKDKKETADVIARHGASADSGEWKTYLWPEHVLKPIKKESGAIRNWMKPQTFETGLKNLYILPASNFLEFSGELSKRLEQRLQTVKEQAKSLSDHIEEARSKRNGLFKAENYPASPEEFVAACQHQVEILPYPKPDRFDVLSLAQAQIDALKANREQRDKEIVEKAMSDLWQRLFEPLQHMAKTLTENGKGKWHRTLLENVKSIVSLIPRLNITGNQQLQAFSDEIGLLLNGTAYELLKDSEVERRNVANQASDIARRMSAYV